MGTNIELKLTTETTKIIINHDPDGIKQVLINLIQNAAQAMENDGIISVRIDVISNWNRHFVQISVTDNGPGISEPYKIFEPFYTTKTSGSGLGLAVTRQIIIKHGGKITAKNRDNAGAEFKISLPF
ncbi:MAG: hypothetical protein DWQ10_14025 [Calditrichaeota bacterium]|nr:MAG: hypothetical protein DWQ10_14025 [Calditrichota bacterium]